LKAEYLDTGKVRFVWRPLPVLGNESMRAAEAAECAREQGKFWEYHDMLYDNWGGVNQGAFSDFNLKRFAQQLGLETQTFNACFDTRRYFARLQEEVKAARLLGIQSVPSLFINTQRFEGLRDYSVYKSAIEQELNKK
jgi:protein-disulfide isomerase